MIRRFLLPLALCATFGTANAAEITGRYVLEKVEQGYLRLDSLTGVLALCSAPSGIWECKAVKDDSLTGSDQELTRLRTENETLKQRLAQLEKGAGTDKKLPSDQEVDRMMDIFGKMFDRFLDFSREMDGKTKRGTSL